MGVCSLDLAIAITIPTIVLDQFSVYVKFYVLTCGICSHVVSIRIGDDSDYLLLHYIDKQEYLDEYVGPHTRRTILYQEYVRGISSTGMQSNYGFEGQVNACWTHKITSKELEVIRSAGFLISVIHGRHDIIAQIYYARKLAEKLQPMARMVDLHGGHLVSHERPEEVFILFAMELGYRYLVISYTWKTILLLFGGGDRYRTLFSFCHFAC
uniref:Uncharacterized protein n=1 Tax=Nelumbo nucifera TaxID=4432 RepID=A0A822YVS6_NELNU|nr:TPA_asm: hypothetical protein HUJ06_006863 [Nelumbo nucifera]